ncbi:MAG: leucyl aminopeptidase family protein [Planctomycetes bacterium]|nr:leucyl aminopeptidase family protein [Planctomycetota bacterium]
MHELRFPGDARKAADAANTILLLASADAWSEGWPFNSISKELGAAAASLMKGLKPGSTGALAETRVATKRLVVAVLPTKLSRHNCPARNEAVLSCAKRARIEGESLALVCLDAPAHGEAVAVALSRALPNFSRKTEATKNVRLAVAASDRRGHPVAFDQRTQHVVAASRWAAECVDTPPADLNTDTFVTLTRSFIKGLKGVKVTEIVGPALLKKRCGGIHAVGRAAMKAPRLLILEHGPKKSKRTVALVGKGVVYDTGGLSLKPTTGMCTMKGDMGGAAAVVGAFKVLVESGFKGRLVALAALAENAIGPDSYRNDDILTLHSGHTVEINNTDAEGRLLLADAVSYAARVLEAEVIIDVATLTGAQLVATGMRHAAVVSNRQGLEELAVQCGKSSGDLVHPLPFAPEFYQAEFASAVADMRNSVKDRSNAQSSCAAQFVWAHIDDIDPHWLHVDIAGPAFRDDRGTGFGVGLLASVAEELGAADLKN